MKASTDRILTTHVGSMPRPESIKSLLRARLAEVNGRSRAGARDPGTPELRG